MITVCYVKILMKCVHTFITDRHKCQADITLLFEYIFLKYTSSQLWLNHGQCSNSLDVYLLVRWAISENPPADGARSC